MVAPMVAGRGPRRRTRGEIETLPSGSLRVNAYAGIDPLTKKKHHLTETVPAGPSAVRDAEKVRTRWLAQVDERRNPRTRRPSISFSIAGLRWLSWSGRRGAATSARATSTFVRCS